MKLFDSEWKVMELLWSEGELPAKDVAAKLSGLVGWNKNTSYTVLKKCVDKGIIERREPNFICHPLISREQARQAETDALLDRVFQGSAELLVASLLSSRRLSAEELERLRRLVEEYDG